MVEVVEVANAGMTRTPLRHEDMLIVSRDRSVADHHANQTLAGWLESSLVAGRDPRSSEPNVTRTAAHPCTVHVVHAMQERPRIFAAHKLDPSIELNSSG